MTDQPMQTIVAADNPELAQKLVDQALAGGAAAPQPAYNPVFPEKDTSPGDNIVNLPGGYITQQGDVITTVEIEELNGFAEEALARPMTLAKRLQTVLESSVSKVGDLEPNVEILNRMLASDRNAILLAVAQLTYGDTTYGAQCPHCHETVDLTFNLRTDVPMKKLDDPSNRNFTAETSLGTAEMTLPTGEVQNEVMSVDGRNEAETASITLKGMINSIGGRPNTGLPFVRSLSIRDRRALLRAYAEHECGPDVTAIPLNCPACGGVIKLSINLADLFQS